MFKRIGSELLGLFVDDVAFAAATLGWLLACWLVLPRLGMPSPWPGIVLFAGLAAILLQSALRRARA